MKINFFVPICALLSICHLSHQVAFIPPGVKERFGDALEAIFGMGIRLQVLLDEPSVVNKENFIISPISAALVIGQLMLGADGEFREHLYDLLSLPKAANDKTYVLKSHSKNGTNTTIEVPYLNLHLQLTNLVRELKKDPNSTRLYTLESTNVMFISKNIELFREFRYESEFLYNTELIPVNFRRSEDTLRQINSWAANHTNGLIPELLAAPPSPMTSSIFANAIYFLGEWEQPFSDEINTQGQFLVAPEKSVEVTFMSGFLESVPYTENKRLNCKMVVLPYKDREVGMYIVLPNKGHKHEYNIWDFAKSTKTADYLEMIENLKERDVNIKLPKLSLSTSLSMLKPLKKYANYKKMIKLNQTLQTNILDELDKKIDSFKGFKSDADIEIILTAAAKNSKLRISDIFQQMTFAINEKGTEAAAITAGIIDYSGGSKSFLANKPFLFFIRHEATAATLFWGTISNPNV